jgi:2-polyprenyl-3-methyl-5-hydroxy-6-metoxy-1,4-benzoquinol methylase
VKHLDRSLRRRRLDQAVRRIPIGARVLDVGCHDGALFRAVGFGLRDGIGIDADLLGELASDSYRLLPGRFPDDLPADVGTFDVITMLAVFEHVPADEQRAVVDACWRLLRGGGSVVLTVPSALVDPILDALVAVRLIDGMQHEEHHGFEPSDLAPLFRSVGFELAEHRRFQFGLNNVFVFRRPG